MSFRQNITILACMVLVAAVGVLAVDENSAVVTAELVSAAPVAVPQPAKPIAKPVVVATPTAKAVAAKKALAKAVKVLKKKGKKAKKAKKAKKVKKIIDPCIAQYKQRKHMHHYYKAFSYHTRAAQETALRIRELIKKKKITPSVHRDFSNSLRFHVRKAQLKRRQLHTARKAAALFIDQCAAKVAVRRNNFSAKFGKLLSSRIYLKKGVTCLNVPKTKFTFRLKKKCRPATKAEMKWNIKLVPSQRCETVNGVKHCVPTVKPVRDYIPSVVCKTRKIRVKKIVSVRKCYDVPYVRFDGKYDKQSRYILKGAKKVLKSIKAAKKAAAAAAKKK